MKPEVKRRWSSIWKTEISRFTEIEMYVVFLGNIRWYYYCKMRAFQKTTNFEGAEQCNFSWSCVRLAHYTIMSWEVFQKMMSERNNNKRKHRKQILNKSNCPFLDQYNSSENGRNYCQKSIFWNWNFSRKNTFVFNSVSYDALYILDLVTQGWRSVENVIKLGYYILGK